MNEGMIRIPGHRPIPKQYRPREVSADARAPVGRPPDPNKERTKYGQMRKGNVLMNPGKIRKVREASPAAKGNSLRAFPPHKPPTSQSSLQNALERLQMVWDTYQVDSQYQAEFRQAVESVSLRDRMRAVQAEMDFGDQSYAVRLSKAVVFRETLIQELLQLDLVEPSDLNRWIERLNKLRLSAVQAVDSLKELRNHLAAVSPVRYQSFKFIYWYNGENYLLKMQTDTGFLVNSPLAQYFDFSPEKDPFLVTPSKPKSRKKIDLVISPKLAKKIDTCINVLLIESVENHVKNSPFEERKKKVPPRRVHQPEPRAERSGPHTPQSPASPFKSPQLEYPVALPQYFPMSSPDRRIIRNSPAKPSIQLIKMDNYSDSPSRYDEPVVTPIELDDSPETPEESTPVYPITLHEPVNFSEELTAYSREVPEKLSEVIGSPEAAYAQSQELKYPAYLWAHRGPLRIGLIVLNLETQKTSQKRLQVTHLSTTSFEYLPELLSLCVDYIWSTYPCIEIRIGLVSHKNEQGKYETDKEVKQHFDGLGFRWKQMLFTKEKSTPLQVLGLRRPEDKVCTNVATAALFGDCIELAYGCVVQTNLEAEETTQDGPIYPYSLLGLSVALKAVGSSLEVSCNSLQALVNKLQPGWVPATFRFRKDEESEKSLKDLHSLGLSVSGLGDAFETILACSALGLSWSKHLTGTVNGKPFTKVYDAEITLMRSNEHTVYLVPTEDPNFNTFFIPFNQVIWDSFATAKQILSQISDIEGVINTIWIPEFRVNKENPLKTLEGASVDEYSVSYCTEVVDFKISACKHPKGSLPASPESGELVLEPPFLFGVVHTKLDEELEVPYIVLYIR